eukprot:TRINITY_DN57916_c0_g1_i1.p1 TRINITY_DN57916_c0_g1~~TRINITY_DN57916_c0_g1_i1.p1  ORF type:complete len:266 (-),score=42.32 TRINITY_DN57916_c0_g1_i1:76-873(-)
MRWQVSLAMPWKALVTLLSYDLLSVSGEEISELPLDDTCSGSCSLELVQKKAIKETRDISIEEQTWQGERETGSKCMFSCDGSLGPTDCYHFRCICKETHIYDKETDTCILHSEAVKKNLVSARETGSTCKWKSCQGEATTCDTETYKCLCIPAYTFKKSSCQFDPLQGVREQQAATKETQGSPTTTQASVAGDWPDAWPDAGGAEPVVASGGGATAPSGKCLEQIKWAKSDGIYAHPDWYPGLSPQSPDVDFQKQLHKSGDSAC